jgi:hypothetical protein
MVDQLLAQSTRLNATTAAALTIVEEQFNLTTKKLNEIISKFGQEMERGLKQDLNLKINQDDKSFMFVYFLLSFQTYFLFFNVDNSLKLKERERPNRFLNLFYFLGP